MLPLTQTSEGRAFLREVCEHPHDDAPRLVFADWLDDHGDHDRAEFIRLQCSLASGDWRLAVAERARELWYERGTEWLDEIPAWLRARCEYARGFAALVKCTTVEWLAKAGELELVPIETVRLSGVGRRVAEVAASPHLRRVAALDLSDNHLGDNDMGVLAVAPAVSRLHRLDLSLNNVGNYGVGLLTASPHLADLRELDLSANHVGDEGARYLANSPRFRQLRRLHLGHNEIGDDGARALARPGGLVELEIVNLHNNRVSDALTLELFQQERPAVRP